MTRYELRVFLNGWFCGCGNPQMAAASLLEILSLAPFYNHRQEIETLLPDEGIRYLMLYALDHFKLTTHGSSIGGSWLTDKGRAVLDALNRETADNYETLLASSCIHGYVDSETCPECEG